MSWPGRRSKYNAQPVIIDGIRFPSKGEGRRYQELKILEQQGHIKDLTLQPKFDFVVNDFKICGYRGDFAYTDADGKKIIEDKKGFKTPEYVIKRKLFMALFGHEYIHRES